MDFGGIFDFGGTAAGDVPMTTPEENGGFLGWLLDSPGAADGAAGYAGGGGMAASAAAAAAAAAGAAKTKVQQAFIHTKLADLLEGSDFMGEDLITYEAPAGGGWWPDVGVTPAGKKWGLILLAAGVGFWMVKRK